MDKTTVTFKFEGKDAANVAERFFAMVVDGGAEDYLMDRLQEVVDTEVDATSCDMETLEITITSK